MKSSQSMGDIFAHNKTRNQRRNITIPNGRQSQLEHVQRLSQSPQRSTLVRSQTKADLVMTNSGRHPFGPALGKGPNSISLVGGLNK